MSIPFTWIYLIRDRDTGYYKVGKSDNPDQRLASLRHQATQQPTPNDYELLEAWLCPESTEAELHARFKESEIHIRGEWFNLLELYVKGVGTVEKVLEWMNAELSSVAAKRWITANTLPEEQIDIMHKIILELTDENNRLKGFITSIQRNNG